MFEKILRSVCVIMLLLIIWSVPLHARDLLIYGVPAPPMRYLDENNELQGFDIEVIEYILGQKLGIDYEVKFIDSSPRIEAEWQKGSFDMLLTYSYKEARARILDVSERISCKCELELVYLKKEC